MKKNRNCLAVLFAAASLFAMVSGCGGADGSEAGMVTGQNLESEAAKATPTGQTKAVDEGDQKLQTPGTETSPAKSESQSFECGQCIWGAKYCCWCDPINGCYSCGTYGC